MMAVYLADLLNFDLTIFTFPPHIFLIEIAVGEGLQFVRCHVAPPFRE
jgi:hypothetical protein